MVGFKNIGWAPETKKEGGKNLQILAFETAKTMSRLVSLYKSISDEEISRLQNDVVRSKGVAFLNSTDVGYLLSLACAEKLQDLDRAADVVSHLSKKCSDFQLNKFDLVYKDLKLGIMKFRKVKYGSTLAEKKIKKMEKLVATTRCLHVALERLLDLEISEKKMKQLKFSRLNEFQVKNIQNFSQKLENQKKEIEYLKEISLWSKSFDSCVGLMVKIVCVVFTRIRFVFGPRVEKTVPYSGLISTSCKPVSVSSCTGTSHFGPGPETLGGSGLAMRYANLILLAEKYLNSTAEISYDEREMFYEMLPENLRIMVRKKLRKKMRCAAKDASMAEGWREAMAEMMTWLVPVAEDTMTWQAERNIERMRFDEKSCVVLVQTLYFSDREKTEAAIVEILVGLSWIIRFEDWRFGHDGVGF